MSIHFCETLPSCLQFNADTKFYPQTSSEIIKLIRSAKTEILSISFYFDLELPAEYKSYSEKYPSWTNGNQVADEILAKSLTDGVSVRLIANAVKSKFNPPSPLFEYLQSKNPKIMCRYLNMDDMIRSKNSGIEHTKLWVIDGTAFYLGSSNGDWKSYSEVIESGVVGINNEMAEKLKTIFEFHWKCSRESTTNEADIQSEVSNCPSSSELLSRVSSSRLLSGDNNLLNECYRMAVSPSILSPSDIKPFDTDLMALGNIIDSAKEFICISTYEYSPFDPFAHPRIYWAFIDEKLKKAAYERNVTVKFMIEHKNAYKNSLDKHALRNLTDFPKINVKTIKLPALDVQVPYSRVLHAKLIINEDHVWIGTNNLSVGYFMFTGGISMTLNKKTFPQVYSDSLDFYTRYWNCQYAQPIACVNLLNTE